MASEEFDEEAGIAAIIFLQAQVGITETREKAISGWHRMRAHEKTFTLQVYKYLTGGYDPKKADAVKPSTEPT